MKIAILTTPGQWFESYAHALSGRLNGAQIYFDHREVAHSYDVVFILSYHKIIEEEYLRRHRHNLVVHASDLPEGKGWAPLFWQVLEGKRNIVFSMIEASAGVDAGDVYMKKSLALTGYELNEELRQKQAQLTIDMCLEFIADYEAHRNPTKQEGVESFYKKRSSKDSELDPDKTIREQFNLLRIVNNDEYPAFFNIDGRRYELQILASDYE